jgi:hypothetical protein
MTAIISARRPNSVASMVKFAPHARWYVAVGDGESYSNAGAEHVTEAGSLCDSRNMALEDAFRQGKACVQLSDDLFKLQQVDDDLTLWDITLKEAIEAMCCNIF